MSASGKLQRKQEALIGALLSEPTIATAAARAGIGEATAIRWLKLPEVQAAYRDARRQVVEHALAAVQSATSEAVEALRRNLRPDMPPGVQVRAALGVLEHAMRAVELGDLAARIEHLEQLACEQRDPVGRRYA